MEQVFPANGPRRLSAAGIATPFQFYTTGEENLRVQSLNSKVGVRLAVYYRFLNEDGEIAANVIYHVPNTDRTERTSDHALGKGAILNLIVDADTGAPAYGETFVHVHLIRGLGGATLTMGTLVQGYVTAQQLPAYPGSVLMSSVDGPGALRYITGTNPAAGVEISETVPTNVRWELVSLFATLTPTAVGANRWPILNIFGPGLQRATWVQASGQAPADGAPHGFGWSQGVPQSFALAGVIFPNSGLVQNQQLRAGSVFRTETVALAAGDNWSAPYYIVREWFEVP